MILSIQTLDTRLLLINSLYLSGAKTMSRYESKVPIRETKAPPVGALGHSGGCKIFQKKELQNRERQKIAKWVTLDQN